MTFHCFFEQSGTFKNEFKKLGYEAYDYDILNDYGETDYQIDLFKEIQDAYTHTHTHTRTVFDNVKEGDQIIAFFPCVRFEDQIMLHMRCECVTMVEWDDIKKLEYSKKLNHELAENYELISNMVIVCLRKGIKLIIENPYSAQHYLKQYWSIRPSIIDKDRTERGDWMKKPTQYYFINRKPSNNFIFEPAIIRPMTKVKKVTNDGNEKRITRRSKIMPEYANRFIREFII